MRLPAVVGALGLMLVAGGCHGRRTLKLDAGVDAAIGETSADAEPQPPSVDAVSEADAADAAIETAPRACAATCTTPAGPLASLPTEGDVSAAIRGRWLFCSGQDLWSKFGAPKDAIGVEYAADGTMTYLVAGATGPVRGVGAAYALTYSAAILLGRPPVLSMYVDPNHAFNGSIRYAACPRALLLSPLGFDPTGTMLVATEDQAGPLPVVAPEDEVSTTPPVDPACAATCGTAASGSVPGDRLQGRWRICSDIERWRPLGLPADVVGIELGVTRVLPAEAQYVVGGDLYYLVDGPEGPVRGKGLFYRASYSVAQSVRSTYELTVHVLSGDVSGVFSRMACPSTLELWGNLPHGTLVQF